MNMNLSPAEQRELSERMEKKKVKQFIDMYSKFVQRCFDDCINDFSSKKIKSTEEGCVLRCIDVQFKTSERLGKRFAEQNQATMQDGGSQ